MDACSLSRNIPWGRGVAGKARPPPRSNPPKFQRDCRPGPISRHPNTFAAPDLIRGPGACPERSRRADPKSVACSPWTPDLRSAPSGAAIEGGVRGRQGTPAPLLRVSPATRLEPKRFLPPLQDFSDGFTPEYMSSPFQRFLVRKSGRPKWRRAFPRYPPLPLSPKGWVCLGIAAVFRLWRSVSRTKLPPLRGESGGGGMRALRPFSQRNPLKREA